MKKYNTEKINRNITRIYSIVFRDSNYYFIKFQNQLIYTRYGIPCLWLEELERDLYQSRCFNVDF